MSYKKPLSNRINLYLTYVVLLSGSVLDLGRLECIILKYLLDENVNKSIISDLFSKRGKVAEPNRTHCTYYRESLLNVCSDN